MKLRITISKDLLWYLRQISLQIMLLPIQINQQKHFTIAKRAQKQSKQHRQMLLDINQFNGSIAWKLKKRPRQDIRLNEVNWNLVVTLLLGNSGYQHLYNTALRAIFFLYTVQIK